MSRKGYIALIITIVLISTTTVFAIDPPHGGYDCSACHSLHGSSGAGLTNQPDNATLCIVCHSPGGDASNRPFASGMIAVPGTSGHSHSWEATMPAAPTTADSTYGLVAISELTIPGLQANAQRYADLGEGISCGVCHNQHSQAALSWDPIITDSGTTDTDGAVDGSTVVDTTAGWGVLTGFNVKITSGAHSGEVRVIQSNTATTLTVTPVFSGQILTGVTYEIDDDDAWHFMRVDNDLNQMCEDCHQWRTTAGETDTRTYTGNRKSHPIVSNLTTDVTDSTQFVGAAPLENNGNAQTGAPRYAGNGTGDSIVTNNIVFDTAGKLRCLSCHGVHYSDSDDTTEEDIASVGAGDGNLLKRSVEDTCHGCHKTDRNFPLDPDSIKMHNSDNLTDAGWGVNGWGVLGGQYGEFGCTTCHTPHGTDNIFLIKETVTAPNSPINDFPGSIVDFRNMSGTEGGTTGAYSYGDDTACVEPTLTTDVACAGGGGTWDASVPRCTFPAFTDSGACTGAGHTWSPRTTSTRICEVCHSLNTYHRYDSSGQTNFSHNNATDCTGCHNHKQAFLGAGDCVGCHSSQQGTGRRDVASATGDLVKTSHHIQYTLLTDVVEESCKACHGDLVADQSHPGSFTVDPNTEVQLPDTGTYITSNDGAGLDTFCLECHDANGATRLGANALQPFTDSGDNTAPPNINTSWAKTYTHNTNAECMDCHGNTGNNNTTLNPRRNAHGSDIGPLLTDGITPTNSINPGAAPTGYTGPAALGSADEQYKICFKCHTNWTGNPTLPLTTQDVAIPFNPANDSYHCVEYDLEPTAGTCKVNTAGTSKGIWQNATFNLTDTATSGALLIDIMIPRAGVTHTNANLRSRVLRCSDCHGDDVADTGVPEGPHGSTGGPGPTPPPVPTILKIPAGSNYRSWDCDTTIAAGDAWCFNCHNPNFTGSGFAGDATHTNHSVSTTAPPDGCGTTTGHCMACHLQIPHGQTGSLEAGQRQHLFRPDMVSNAFDSLTSGNYTEHGAWALNPCTP